MVNNFKYSVAKALAKSSFYALKVMPTGGKSFPGLLFIRLAGKESINKLSKDQVDIGSILITGTNGKTSTTTMIIKMLSRDLEVATSVENNTIYALTTGLLRNRSQMGIFEYGIRDIEHGTPDQVCALVEPIGVIYTNISREHAQVAGVKNPFEDYVKAKTMLSQTMSNGIIITNADDPNTTYIGLNKESDNQVIYYGLELDNLEDIFGQSSTKCPNCGNQLKYEKHYINQRGIYACDCGFKRPEPDVKVTKYIPNENSSTVTIEVDAYNYHQKKNIQFTLDMELHLTGIHNIYNSLTAISAYTAFTTNTNIKESILDFFSSYRFTVPPGRFEVLNIASKKIGVGQGDNGDALKVNSNLFNSQTEGEIEFIYTTPDELEEEIFEDHSLSIKAINPNKLIVMPGRVSLDAAEKYYNQLKDHYNSEYIPVEFDFEQRINKIVELIQNSEYDNIIISGCGEEIVFWEELKKKIKNLSL